MATSESQTIVVLGSVEPPTTVMQPPTLPPTMIASHFKRRLLQWIFRAVEASMMLKQLRDPIKAWRALGKLSQTRQTFHGELCPRKMARVDGRYYRGYHAPGWPSAAFTEHFLNNVSRSTAFRRGETTLDMVVMAITKKCPMSCEHCFEWEALNKTEQLSLADIKSMVARFQVRHVTRILISGGEPLLRCDDILQVLAAARPGTDFWILTSGFHFTREKALKLKAAGLIGVSISLDHFDPEAHNAFRGSPKAWDAAIQAVTFARQVGLVVNLSLCVTKEFTSDENLMHYARLAKQLGVTFIQLLEPRSVGHYAGKNVDLQASHIEILERFYERMNYGEEYLAWPIVSYSGYQQRRQGCSGAGNRFLYVDTDGDMHACPFCQKKCGSALEENECGVEQSIEAVRSSGCQKFVTSSQ